MCFLLTLSAPIDINIEMFSELNTQQMFQVLFINSNLRKLCYTITKSCILLVFLELNSFPINYLGTVLGTIFFKPPYMPQILCPRRIRIKYFGSNNLVIKQNRVFLGSCLWGWSKSIWPLLKKRKAADL